MDLNRLSRLRALCAGAPLLLAALVVHAPAHAQYSWIDEHGTRVFSDRPPPTGTPPSRILRAPRTPASASPYALPAPAGPATAGPSDAAKPAPPTLADREADFRKRAAQRDADERKALDEAQRKADAAEQCAAARRSEASLTSGTRVAEVDDKGERIVLSDEEKARRLAQARRALANCR